MVRIKDLQARITNLEDEVVELDLARYRQAEAEAAAEELRRENSELTVALDAARAEIDAAKVVSLPRKKRQSTSSLFDNDA